MQTVKICWLEWLQSFCEQCWASRARKTASPQSLELILYESGRWPDNPNNRREGHLTGQQCCLSLFFLQWTIVLVKEICLLKVILLQLRVVVTYTVHECLFSLPNSCQFCYQNKISSRMVQDQHSVCFYGYTIKILQFWWPF